MPVVASIEDQKKRREVMAYQQQAQRFWEHKLTVANAE